ncbi:MAG: substrate-binding domain-containing protein [Actinomycetota bacterium]|nr:substrate-binding domain-containing protein [Actinomycetota bacterium]
MRSRKGIRWILLIAVFALVAAACGGDDDTTTTVAGGDDGGDTPVTAEGSITVLLPDSASSARWETDDRRFFEEAFTAAGVDFNIVNAEGDPTTQIQQAEAAIADGAKVLLMVNLDSGSGAAIIAQARAADVAIIDYDRLTIEGDGADVYVSFDNEQVGRTMAEVLEPAIDALGLAKPEVVMLNGGPTDNNATLFRNGYNETVEPRVAAGEWNLAADQAVPGWDNQEALTIFEQILVDTSNNVDAVFAANDGLANSVIAALKSAGLGQIPVSGQDATVAGMQNVLAGDQTMSVYKPIKAEAETAAAAAIALLNGESLDSLTGGLTLNNGTNDIPFIALTPIGVTADNIADTVIADGFRTWEEICVGDFAQFCPSDTSAEGAVEGSIAVLLPDSASSARWETDDRRFFEEAFTAAGVDFNIVNAEGDPTTQIQQAEAAIADGAKVLLMVNLDSGSGAAIIAQARAADVAIIDYDRLTIEGDGADVYVSFDNEQVGRTMAEVLEPAIDALGLAKPEVVMLNGGPTDNNATLFRNGYNETVEPRVAAGEWNLAADQAVPGWDNQEALTIFEQILVDTSNNVDAVFAANDGLANSVIAALKSAGLGQIPVSGQDATVAGMQNVLAGDQTMSVYKPIKAEAETAAAAAIALLNGESLDSLTGGLTLNNGTNDIPFIALTPIGVTADNIADTVIADGFRTWEEICVGDFEQFCP